jgi:hypothetical protein
MAVWPEALVRYALRPPLSQQRLKLLPDALVRIELKRPFRDGAISVPARTQSGDLLLRRLLHLHADSCAVRTDVLSTSKSISHESNHRPYGQLQINFNGAGNA